MAIDPRSIALTEASVALAALPTLAVLTLTPGRPAGVSVTIENFGNTTSTGNLTLSLSAVPAAQPTAPPQTVATVTRHIHLKPHARLKIPIRFVVPTNFTPGKYQLTPSILSV